MPSASLSAPGYYPCGAAPYRLVLSPCNKMLCVVCDDDVARVFDIVGKQQVCEVVCSKCVVPAFSPCGTQVSLAFGSEVRVVGLQEADVKKSFHGHTNDVVCTTWSPCGRWLVSGGHDASLRIWGSHTHSTPPLLGHTDSVIAITSSTSKVFSASRDATIRVWDLRSHSLLFVMNGHSGLICGLRLHGNYVVSCGDTTVRVWDAASGGLVHALEGHGAGVCDIALSQRAGEVLIASSDASHEVRLWKLGTGECLAVLPPPSRGVQTEHYGVELGWDSKSLFISRTAGVEVMILCKEEAVEKQETHSGYMALRMRVLQAPNVETPQLRCGWEKNDGFGGTLLTNRGSGLATSS